MASNLESIQFAENAEPRCPVVLLLDTSGSMYGEKIDELNAGVGQLATDLKGHTLASQRVELAIVVFGEKVEALDVRSGGGGVPWDANQAFVTADEFQPPRLEAAGTTPLGEAMIRSLALLRERKDIYKRNSIDYFRPWIFLLTDGQPDGGWEPAADQARAEEDRKGVLIFPIAVGDDADAVTLGRFSTRAPMRLNPNQSFVEMFRWVSASLSAVAQSQPGDQLALPAAGWGTIVT